MKWSKGFQKNPSASTTSQTADTRQKQAMFFQSVSLFSQLPAVATGVVIHIFIRVTDAFWLLLMQGRFQLNTQNSLYQETFHIHTLKRPSSYDAWYKVKQFIITW